MNSAMLASARCGLVIVGAFRRRGARGGADKAGATLTAEKVRAAAGKLEKLTEQTLKETGVPGIAIGVYRTK